MRKIKNNVVFFLINGAAALFLIIFMITIVSRKGNEIIRLETQKDSLDYKYESLQKETFELYKKNRNLEMAIKLDSINDALRNKKK